MAKVEDYMPGGSNDPAGGINDAVADADGQQQARQSDATPNVDWEQRYKELETLNSRQAQDLGTYRKMVDDHILGPTPATPVVEQESAPITADDLYDNPDEAVRRAVESHPAIQEARDIKAQLERRDLEDSIKNFQARHPDYNEISSDPKFRNWVDGDVMRSELFARGNQYDLSAADALFRLYKAENNITQMTDEQTQAQAIQAASLEDSSNQMVQEPAKYSRTEYVKKLQRAKQGDLDCEDWIKHNAAGYREALASGNVRD